MYIRPILRLARRLGAGNHDVKFKLKVIGFKQSYEYFYYDVIIKSIINGFLLGFSTIFFLLKGGYSLLWIPFFIFIFIFVYYYLNIKFLDVKILRKGREIDKDVLYAGRYLYIKLSSGMPLSAALQEATKSYGVASLYFGNIVQKMDLGMPLENALDEASMYSPSRYFRRIIFQISNAMKIGIDVSSFLEATLDEIAAEQLLEIDKYGKKLSSITLFYMIAGVVIPSLGMSLVILVLVAMDLAQNTYIFWLLGFGVFLVQIFFIRLYGSIRPNVDM